jgi:hypothetical protein
MTLSDVVWGLLCLALPLAILLALVYGLRSGFSAFRGAINHFAQKYLAWWLHRS